MAHIGIVGAGVSGLHLGLLLRDHGVPVTLYAERSAAEVTSGPLLNTVVHKEPTVQRERALGIRFWDDPAFDLHGVRLNVAGEHPMQMWWPYPSPGSGVDYRLYLPRLMDEFAARGGQLEVGPLRPTDVEPISARHDLTVVAAGRGPFTALFPERPERIPYDRPQRNLCAGLWFGVTPPSPRCIDIHLNPEVGELAELPVVSFEPGAHAILFEAIPGGEPAEVLTAPVGDLDTFAKTALRLIQTYWPTIADRIDPDHFRLARPLDLLIGSITPAIREDYAVVGDGRCVLAMGDVHSVVDPLMGQGANAASHSAWVIGHAILGHTGPFDAEFCRRVASERAELVEGAQDLTNFMLGPKPPHFFELIGAMARDEGLRAEFGVGLCYPHLNARLLTPEGTAERLARL